MYNFFLLFLYLKRIEQKLTTNYDLLKLILYKQRAEKVNPEEKPFSSQSNLDPDRATNMPEEELFVPSPGESTSEPEGGVPVKVTTIPVNSAIGLDTTFHIDRQTAAIEMGLPLRTFNENIHTHLLTPIKPNGWRVYFCSKHIEALMEWKKISNLEYVDMNREEIPFERIILKLEKRKTDADKS